MKNASVEYLRYNFADELFPELVEVAICFELLDDIRNVRLQQGIVASLRAERMRLIHRVYLANKIYFSLTKTKNKNFQQTSFKTVLDICNNHSKNEFEYLI